MMGVHIEQLAHRVKNGNVFTEGVPNISVTVPVLLQVTDCFSDTLRLVSG